MLRGQPIFYLTIVLLLEPLLRVRQIPRQIGDKIVAACLAQNRLNRGLSIVVEGREFVNAILKIGLAIVVGIVRAARIDVHA